MYNDFVIYPRYMGLPVIPSRSAFTELEQCGISLCDVAEILEYGFDCGSGRRKKDVIEKCIWRGNKTLKVVVVNAYNNFYRTGCWLIIHAGVF
ncbi:MAG: hypothetical protein HYW05_02165 [Candidatus Diapherotrites archaeon]|nr:hypothetical protein [Candidatus Diapherotrites archaeon]